MCVMLLLPPRKPHRPNERQRPRGGALQARQPADHQRRERGDHRALRREDRGGAVPGELALQVPQHQEEEEVPHPVLPEEEQKEREDGGLSASAADRTAACVGGGAAATFSIRCLCFYFVSDFDVLFVFLILLKKNLKINGFM